MSERPLQLSIHFPSLRFDDELIKPSEFSQRMNISTTTMRELIDNKDITAVDMTTKNQPRYRLVRESVYGFLLKRLTDPNARPTVLRAMTPSELLKLIQDAKNQYTIKTNIMI